MSFRATLERHLGAIRDRDLAALAATLPPEGEPIVLVQADGRVVRTVPEFLQAHGDWFASPTWTLEFQELAALESADQALVTFRLDYRDRPAEGAPVHAESVLTLGFARRGDRWAMVLDQNTPKRPD